MSAVDPQHLGWLEEAHRRIDAREQWANEARAVLQRIVERGMLDLSDDENVGIYARAEALLARKP